MAVTPPAAAAITATATAAAAAARRNRRGAMVRLLGGGGKDAASGRGGQRTEGTVTCGRRPVLGALLGVDLARRLLRHWGCRAMA